MLGWNLLPLWAKLIFWIELAGFSAFYALKLFH